MVIRVISKTKDYLKVGGVDLLLLKTDKKYSC